MINQIVPILVKFYAVFPAVAVVVVVAVAIILV
jgi:hypothetical protein